LSVIINFLFEISGRAIEERRYNFKYDQINYKTPHEMHSLRVIISNIVAD